MNGMVDTGSIAFLAGIVLFILKKVFDIDRKVAEICTKVKYLERHIINDEFQKG